MSRPELIRQALELERDLYPAARLQRLAGFILDASLFWLIAATTVSIVQALRSAVLLAEGEATNPAVAGAAEAVDAWARGLPELPVSPLAVVLILYAVYSLLWWWRAGTTPGKWLVGLEILTPLGRRPGFRRYLVRLAATAVWIGAAVLLLITFVSRGPLPIPDMPRSAQISIELLILAIWWVPSVWRNDRAALQDVISATRVVKAPASGFRIMTRTTLRRGLTDLRWGAAILVALIAGGAGLVFGTRALLEAPTTSASSSSTAMALPVDQVTQEAIKGAILEYNRLEEHATYRLEASILEPRATQSFLARKAEEFSQMRRRGLRQESRLLDADFRGFRWVGDNQIEADVVETWVTMVADVTGRALQERAPHEVPQTAILVRERGRWKISDVRHYENGNSPF